MIHAIRSTSSAVYSATKEQILSTGCVFVCVTYDANSRCADAAVEQILKKLTHS